MKVMIDLNIFIDVFQKRVPHYQDSSLVLTQILNKKITGFIAGHLVTTLYYLISKFSGKQKALEVTGTGLSPNNCPVGSVSKTRRKSVLHPQEVCPPPVGSVSKTRRSGSGTRRKWVNHP